MDKLSLNLIKHQNVHPLMWIFLGSFFCLLFYEYRVPNFYPNLLLHHWMEFNVIWTWSDYIFPLLWFPYHWENRKNYCIENGSGKSLKQKLWKDWLLPLCLNHSSLFFCMWNILFGHNVAQFQLDESGWICSHVFVCSVLSSWRQCLIRIVVHTFFFSVNECIVGENEF